MLICNNKFAYHFWLSTNSIERIKAKKKQTRLDCDRCLDDTVSARYRGVSGGTYRALSECVEKRFEMEKQIWTFLQLIYLICKPQTNRSVCLGRGAPGGVLQNVTTHRACTSPWHYVFSKVLFVTLVHGSKAIKGCLPRHISMRRKQNTGVSVVLSGRETEAMRKWKQTKVVSYISALVGVCQRKHNWQIDNTTKHVLTGSLELLPDAGCPEMQILNFE